MHGNILSLHKIKYSVMLSWYISKKEMDTKTMKEFSRQTTLEAVNTGKQRNDVLDVAKGIGMLFVVFAHVNYTPDILVLIYSFHMPLFFILSGVVFSKAKRPEFGAFLRYCLKTLIYPYLFFSLAPLALLFVIDFGIARFPIDHELSWYGNHVLHTFLAYRSATVFNTPLWFVPCLLAVEILYFWISKLPSRKIAVVCILLSVFDWLLESKHMPFNNDILPWSLDSAFFVMGFFAVGNLGRRYLLSAIAYIKGHKNKVLICLALLCMVGIVWLPLALMNGKISIGSKILHNGFLLYATGILGTLGILIVSILCEKCRFLKFMGLNTFCIMSVHCLIRNYVIYPAYEVLGIEKYDSKVLGETIFPFVLILLLSILVTVVYNFLRKKRILIVW